MQLLSIKLISQLIISGALLSCSPIVVFAATSAPTSTPTQKSYVDLAFKINNSKYTSNGKSKDLDSEPFISQGRTLVPFRYIFDELGYTIEWIAEEKKIIATNSVVRMELKIDNSSVFINDKELPLDVPPQIVNGRTMVPLRFVSENSGSLVEWDASEKTAYILKINPNKSMMISPDQSKALLLIDTRKKYYSCDPDGNNVRLFGSYKDLRWLDNDKLYAESTKKEIINLQKNNLQDVTSPWYSIGNTNDGYVLVANQTSLFYINGDKFVEINAVPAKAVYVYANTIEGPFMVFCSDNKLQILKNNELPVNVGNTNNLVDNTGKIITSNTFLNTTFISTDDKNIAFYQKEAGNLWLNVYKTDELSKSRKIFIDLASGTDESITSLLTTWNSNGTLTIDSDFTSWDISIKDNIEMLITDKRSAAFSYGKTILYVKAADGNRVFFGNDQKASVIVLNNKEIRNWYQFNGKTLATLFDTSTNTMSLVMQKDQAFETLAEDLEIKETFEYNNNLLIHGFDRVQKTNKLYRFDGTKLSLIEDDFNVVKHITFKDYLVVNKYTSSRDYSIVVFDKNNWSPSVLQDTYVINDFVVGSTNLYLLCGLQVGTEKPLALFDGKGMNLANFKAVLSDSTIKASELFEYGDKLYTLRDNQLQLISNGKFNKIIFTPTTGVNAYLSVKHIIQFGDKIYLNGTKFTEIVAVGKKPQLPPGDPDYNNTIYEFDGTSNLKSIVPMFSMDTYYKDDTLVYFIGKKYTESKNAYDDKSMFIYDPTLNISNSNPCMVMDIINVVDTIKIDDMTFIYEDEIPRSTNSKTSKIILYSDNKVEDRVQEGRKNKWEVVDDNLIISIVETDINKAKLCTYDGQFDTVLDSFDISYWSKINDILFTCGLDNKTLTLYKFEDSHKELICKNFRVTNIIDAGNNFYLLYGTDIDPASSTNGQLVLRAYNSQSNDIYPVMSRFEIKNMLQSE